MGSNRLSVTVRCAAVAALATFGAFLAPVAASAATSTGHAVRSGIVHPLVSAPTVTGVAPSSGPSTGGTTVTITGTGFTGATAVVFGAVHATSFNVVSSTSITAVSPAQAPMQHNIYVTTAGGTSAAVPADEFTYVGPPAVSGVSPASGPTSGGTTVTITGTGFTFVTKVVFGTLAATSFNVVSSTSITAVSPAQAPMQHNIFVTTAGGTSAAVSADEFTYVAAPTVTGISPASGPPSGGTTVTITGTGFTGATKVVFGTLAATSFNVVSSTSITAISPAQAPAVHNIFVTTAGGTSAAVSADEFTYVSLPYQVNVGYADDLRPNPVNFPTPWVGDPNVVFEGCTPDCTGWDGGAVEIVNTTGATETVNSVIINFSSACTYNIWPSNVTLAAGDEMIVTELKTAGAVGGCVPAQGFMDSSDIGPNGASWANNCTQSGIIPQLTITVNNTQTVFNDTGQVMNTGGVDGNTCNPKTTNESAQWTAIGQTESNGLAITESPATQALAPHKNATVTANVTDGSGTPLGGVPVVFTVTSGPNAGTTGTATSNSAGNASFTYTSTTTGIDTLGAVVNNTVGTVSATPVTVIWETASLLLSTQDALPGSTVSFTGSGYTDGEIVTLHTNSPSGLLLTTVTASSTGTISGAFTVPVPTTSTPVAAVVSVGTTSGLQGWAPFTTGCTDDWTNSLGGNWNTASDWSTGAVPGPGDQACVILPQTYALDMTQSNTVAGLILGSPSAGTQTLDLEGGGVNFDLNGISTVEAHGVLDMDSPDGNYSLLGGSGTLTNNGTLNTIESNGSTRYLRVNLVNSPSGTVDIGDFDTRVDDGNTVTNNGTFTLSGSGALSVTSGTFVQAGGALTYPADALYLQSSTLDDTGGTISGTAVMNAATFNDNGGSGGTFLLECSDNLSGTIAAGQTVDVQGNACGNGVTSLTGRSVVNDGALELDSVNGNYALIQGANLTNNGTFTALQDNGGTRYIRTNLTNGSGGTVDIADYDTRVDSGNTVTNDGTFTISSTGGLGLTGTGTVFDEAAGTLAVNGTLTANGVTLTLGGGTLSGTATVENSTFADSGGTGGTFVLECSDDLSGTITSTQTVDVQGNACGNAATTLTGASVTNDGTFEMDSTDGNYSLVNGSPLTNNGTFTVLQDNGGPRYIRFNLTNSAGGKVAIDDFDTLQDSGNTLTNEGAFTLAPAAGLTLSGSGTTLDQEGGTLTLSGNLVMSNASFNQAGGTVSGDAVLDSATLADSGGAGGTFILECSDNLSGTITATQTVDVQGNGCGGAVTTLTGASVTNDGTFEMDSTDGNYSLVTGSPLTNNGTFSALLDGGGIRYIRVNLTNSSTGTATIADSDAVMDSGNTLVNKGSFTVASTGALTLSGSSTTFTQAGGTIADNGSLVGVGVTFLFNGGTTTGRPVTLEDGSTFSDDTAGAGDFQFISSATFTTTTPDSAGNIEIFPGQVMDVFDDCTGAANWTAAKSVDVAGTLEVTNAGTCGGYNASVTVPGAITVFSGGSLAVNAPAPGNTGTRQINANVTVDAGGTTTLAAVTQVSGGTVTNNGTVDIGDSAGLALVNSSTFKQGSGGTLGATVDATTGDGYGVSGGTTTVAGTLKVTTVGTPGSGTVYAVISGTTLSGTFATISSPQSYTPTYSGTGLTLTAG